MSIWPLFLIVFYWSSQNLVGTEPIPKEHLKEAILCLREYLGEDYVRKSFRSSATYGEYLGALCECTDENVIEGKIRRDGQENGLKVQQCLAHKHLPDVYRKFHYYGSQRINQQRFSDLTKFIKGLCLKDDSVNFQELENHQDKETAFNCLKHCTTRFLIRIKTSLCQIREKVNKILEDMINVAREFRNNILRSQNAEISNKAITSELIIRECEAFLSNFTKKTEITELAYWIMDEVSYEKQKISVEPSSSHTSSDIDRITRAGKTLITRYAEVYTFIDKFIKDRTGQGKSINLDEFNQVEAAFNAIKDHKSLDVQLIVSFTYYEYCARVECYMKAPSVPLHDFIRENANERSINLQKKFYVTLTSKLENYDDDDDDEEDDDDDDDDD